MPPRPQQGPSGPCTPPERALRAPSGKPDTQGNKFGALGTGGATSRSADALHVARPVAPLATSLTLAARGALARAAPPRYTPRVQTMRTQQGEIMRLGIIGLPNSGKTTLFNALTGSDFPTEPFSSGQLEVHTAVVSVPDARLEHLAEVFRPRKTVYATVTYTDIGGLDKGIGEGGLSGPMRNALAQVDGFLHVVRAFTDPDVPHSLETVDPLRDLTIIDGEFLLLDLITVENRLARLAEERQKGKVENRRQNEQETALMERLHAHLEAEQPLRDMDLTPDELKLLRGYGFLTLKPVLVIFNRGENDPDPAAELDYTHHRSQVISLFGKLEAEIAQLDDPDDVALFLAEYKLEQPVRERVLRLSYELLGIQSFFTYGEDEVRAWPLRKGSTAVEAAGTIHSDLARGFIRAEVVAYDDFVAAGSDMAQVKAQGKFRLEGKEYIVQDGDMIVVRFNV